jgi:hypothetical protein
MTISPCNTVYMLCPHVTHLCVWVLSIKSCKSCKSCKRTRIRGYSNFIGHVFVGRHIFEERTRIWGRTRIWVLHKYMESVHIVTEVKIHNRQCIMYCLFFFFDIRILITLWYIQTFGHCIVFSSSIYGFWLPLWYILTFRTVHTIWLICLFQTYRIFIFVDNILVTNLFLFFWPLCCLSFDYPFGIFKLFL